MGKASSGQNAARRTVAGQENAKTEGTCCVCVCACVHTCMHVCAFIFELPVIVGQVFLRAGPGSVARVLQGRLWPDRRMPKQKVHVCVRTCVCALLSVCLWIPRYCWSGVPASRARASGQHAGKIAGKIVGQEGSAGAENVFAGTGSAPGRNVGGGPGQAGAGVSQGAGEKQGAARCEEIQEPVLASAGGGTRSSLVAGEIPMKKTKEQRLRAGFFYWPYEGRCRKKEKCTPECRDGATCKEIQGKHTCFCEG